MTLSQKIYLSNYELHEAIKIFFNKLGDISEHTEYVTTWEALGRVTAEAVFAKISSPHFNSSAMDGIAVLSSRTHGASEKNPVVLEEEKDYIVVDTGDPIPSQFDCVIMVEDLVRVDEKRVKIYKSTASYQNIRPIGEDIVENQLILPSSHSIRPVDIGAVMAGGVNAVKVYKKPLVGVIPTGTEIVDAGTPLKVGDIIDFNSRVFSAQVEEWGGQAKRYDIQKDIYEDIKSTVKNASETCDIVIINAGSSAGREDFTSKVIEELGEVFIHGVAIKPGKPVILGRINNKPVIGIPGYPVSAYFIMEFIVKKLIYLYKGLKAEEAKVVKAVTSRRIMSSLKYLEFVRVKLGYVGDKLIATPLSRGAGATMSLVQADGILEIPQNIEGIEAGAEVEIKLLKEEKDIKNTLVCIGSHDPIIDIASNMLHEKNKDFFLSSAHVGSMGGVMALKKGETHIAPIHLLDMENGEYNTSYIKKYLSGSNIALIKGVNRIQGLMVKKGNPLNIRTLEDIVIKKAKFVNRQRGSGTRLLLDYLIKKFNLNPEDISGYGREEFTHLSVAAAVAAGDSEVGIGVYSAAALMDLDFIPIGDEEYDLAVPAEYLESDLIKDLIEVMKSSDFKQELDKLGGYDYSKIGTVVLV
jgi:putative molybdopterin biosynthesis protein